MANFKMAVSLEPSDQFSFFNLWEKAPDVYFYSAMTAGPPDLYNGGRLFRTTLFLHVDFFTLKIKASELAHPPLPL